MKGHRSTCLFKGIIADIEQPKWPTEHFLREQRVHKYWTKKKESL